MPLVNNPDFFIVSQCTVREPAALPHLAYIYICVRLFIYTHMYRCIYAPCVHLTACVFFHLSKFSAIYVHITMS